MARPKRVVTTVRKLVYATDVEDLFYQQINSGATDLMDAFDYALEDAPAIEAEPVKHGWWIEKPTGAYGRWQSWCSACGKHSGIGGIESNRHKPYCPNCGAKMDLT